MWYVYEKFMLTATFGTFLPRAQLDWLFLQIPEMSANCLEFHNLSLIWLGSTFWWISWHPCTVQIARNGAAYPALWDQEQLCLLLPRYCEEGVARIKAQVSLKGLFWWFPGWFTEPGEVGKRHVTWLHLRTLCPSVWVGAAVSQARAVLNHQHPGLSVSELQFLWSLLPTWATGAIRTNYWKQDIGVLCQDSQ